MNGKLVAISGYLSLDVAKVHIRDINGNLKEYEGKTVEECIQKIAEELNK